MTALVYHINNTTEEDVYSVFLRYITGSLSLLPVHDTVHLLSRYQIRDIPPPVSLVSFPALSVSLSDLSNASQYRTMLCSQRETLSPHPLCAAEKGTMKS